MTLKVRGLLFGTVACAFTVAYVAMALAAPAAQAAVPFGVETFVAANCIQTHETCGEEPGTTFPKEPTFAEAREAGYTQAAGHPPWGVTAFKVTTEGTFPAAVPTGVVTHVRTDVAPGVSTNPDAVEQCEIKEFEGHEVAPGSGFYTGPECSAKTEIGENKVVVYLEAAHTDLPIAGTAYNLVPPTGRSSDFGVALAVPKFITEPIFHSTEQFYVHTFIEGGVEWASDYHDYYEINVSPALPLVSSRLNLVGTKGNTGNGGFITNPSNCSGPGPLTTNTVTLDSAAGQKAAKTYVAPIGTEGCLGHGLSRGTLLANAQNRT